MQVVVFVLPLLLSALVRRAEEDRPLVMDGEYVSA